MREKNKAVSSQQKEQRPEELRTVQHILLDVGLVMDEKWAGGPATWVLDYLCQPQKQMIFCSSSHLQAHHLHLF